MVLVNVQRSRQTTLLKSANGFVFVSLSDAPRELFTAQRSFWFFFSFLNLRTAGLDNAIMYDIVGDAPHA